MSTQFLFLIELVYPFYADILDISVKKFYSTDENSMKKKHPVTYWLPKDWVYASIIKDFLLHLLRDICDFKPNNC